MGLPEPLPGDVQPVRPIWETPFAPPAATDVNAPAKPFTGISPKWLLGWLGSSVLLLGLADIPQTADIAAAFALTIAFSASMVLLPKVNQRLSGILG